MTGLYSRCLCKFLGNFQIVFQCDYMIFLFLLAVYLYLINIWYGLFLLTLVILLGV